jgi:hypothetical protein
LKWRRENPFAEEEAVKWKEYQRKRASVSTEPTPATEKLEDGVREEFFRKCAGPMNPAEAAAEAAKIEARKPVEPLPPPWPPGKGPTTEAGEPLPFIPAIKELAEQAKRTEAAMVKAFAKFAEDLERFNAVGFATEDMEKLNRPKSEGGDLMKDGQLISWGVKGGGDPMDYRKGPMIQVGRHMDDEDVMAFVRVDDPEDRNEDLELSERPFKPSEVMKARIVFCDDCAAKAKEQKIIPPDGTCFVCTRYWREFCRIVNLPLEKKFATNQ